jgi:hypothetical protein
VCALQNIYREDRELWEESGMRIPVVIAAVFVLASSASPEDLVIGSKEAASSCPYCGS